MTDSGTTLESYTYIGLGTVVERDHPESGVNQTFITSSTGDAGDDVGGLDRFGRVVDQNWTNGTSSTDEFQYSYDQDSNRLSTTNVVNSDFDETYSYDGLNQITGFTQGSSHTQTFSYDSLGNALSVTADSGTPVTSTFNAQNELAVNGGNSLTYDLNGNMTTDQTGQQYVYDAWNRLVTVKNSGGTTIASYSYDGLSRRVSQTESGTTTDLYYSTDDQVLEERVGGSAVTQYVWSPVYVNAMVERDDSTGGGTLNERLYVQQDANWNVTALVNTSGTVVERYTYDPYGTYVVRNADWSVKSGGTAYAWNYEFQGMRTDLATGQSFSLTRELNPKIFKWSQNDSLAYLGGDVNLYRFASNNPIVYCDPSGNAIALSDKCCKLLEEYNQTLKIYNQALAMFGGAAQTAIYYNQAFWRGVEHIDSMQFTLEYLQDEKPHMTELIKSYEKDIEEALKMNERNASEYKAAVNAMEIYRNNAILLLGKLREISADLYLNCKILMKVPAGPAWPTGLKAIP